MKCCWLHIITHPFYITVKSKLQLSMGLNTYSQAQARTPKSNDKRCSKLYATSGKIISKNVIPYLFIASHLLESTPMYKPSDEQFKIPISNTTHQFINISNYVFDTNDPLHDKSANDHVAFPTTSKRKEKKWNTIRFDTDSFVLEWTPAPPGACHSWQAILLNQFFVPSVHQ